MSNLLIAEDVNVCPSLSKIETEIIVSANTGRISALKKKDIAKDLKNAIGQAVLAIGSKTLTEDDILMMVKQLTDYLNIKHQNARIGEVVNAIKLGSFGEYKKDSDVLYISAANIIQWFKRYEVEKIETLKKQSKFEQEILEDEIEKQKFMEAKEKYWEDLPKNIADCALMNGGESKMASIYFENLWKLGLLNLNKKEINDLKDIAKQEAKQVLREQRKNLVRIGEENIKNMANKIAKEKAFYLWIEENRFEEIEETVRKAIKDGR